jgi:anaerobic selenocysteine-containing dehydrogenase
MSGPIGERAAHAEGIFKTPSGKCEFNASAAAKGDFIVPVWQNGYNEMQPGDPVDPVPDYIPPTEVSGADAALAKRYPICLISPKSGLFSTRNMRTNRCSSVARASGQSPFIRMMRPARKVKDGDYIRVFNDRGSFEGCWPSPEPLRRLRCHTAIWAEPAV